MSHSPMPLPIVGSARFALLVKLAIPVPTSSANEPCPPQRVCRLNAKLPQLLQQRFTFPLPRTLPFSPPSFFFAPTSGSVVHFSVQSLTPLGKYGRMFVEPSRTESVMIAEQKRSVVMRFRVSPEERDILIFLSRRDRRTVSDYIRLTLFDFARNNGNGWREWLDTQADPSYEDP